MCCSNKNYSSLLLLLCVSIIAACGPFIVIDFSSNGYNLLSKKELNQLKDFTSSECSNCATVEKGIYELDTTDIEEILATDSPVLFLNVVPGCPGNEYDLINSWVQQAESSDCKVYFYSPEYEIIDLQEMLEVMPDMYSFFILKNEVLGTKVKDIRMNFNTYLYELCNSTMPENKQIAGDYLIRNKEILHNGFSAERDSVFNLIAEITGK